VAVASGGARGFKIWPILFVSRAKKYFSSKTSAKSHVKPQNRLTLSNKTRSSWHFSYTPPAIIKLEIKKSPGIWPGLSIAGRKILLTHLFGIFWTQPHCYEYFTDIDLPYIAEYKALTRGQ
jgi:hypothetical protein